MTESGYQPVDGLLIEQTGAVLVVSLDRPEARNAINDDMLEAFVKALEAANVDEAVRALLVKGSGEHFCGGADIIARNVARDERPRVGAIQRRLPAQAHRLIPLLCSIQVPVVCSVKGWAVGIGLHIAAAADFTVAATDARFWSPFAKRGFTPDSGGTWLLPRRLGQTRARELLLLGRQLSGSEALEWGLAHQVVPVDEVDATAMALAADLADGPTVSLGLTRWLIHAGSALALEEHLANEGFAVEISSRSEDFREGLAALKEHRAPRFKGR